MIASSIKDDPITNVVSQNRYKYLKTAAIYGANSSGKSNLVKAMGLMGNMVTESVKLNDNDDLPYDPFLLSNESKNKPTHLEIVYLQDNIRVRYGFEYTLTSITEEWLFIKKGMRRKMFYLFEIKKELEFQMILFRRGRVRRKDK